MLVDQDGFELVLSDGFVAGEGCDDECCGTPQCGWFRVLECPPQEQLCGPVPLPREAYVWSCLLCGNPAGGPSRPLGVGDVFLWDNACWTVQDDPPVDLPPQGALVRTDLTPVQCAGEAGCASPLCPNRDTAVYYIASPCVTGLGYPTVFVCGFSGTCAVFTFTVTRVLPNGGGTERRAMCYTVRRSNPVPGDQVPPTAERFDVTGLVGARTCCECIAAGQISDLSCAIGQLWNGQTNGCFPSEEQAVKPCCCGLDSGGGFAGRLRVDRFDAVQDVGFAGGGTRFLITRTIESVSYDAEGCEILHIREHVVDNATGQESDQFFDIQPDGFNMPACRSCGWGFVPYNVNPQGALIGGPGQTWGFDCEGFNDPGLPGHNPSLPWCTANWSLSVECDRLIMSVTYTYFDPSSVQTIVTSFATEMHYAYDPADEQCNGGCSSGSAGAGNAVEGFMDGVIVSDGAGGVRKAAPSGSVTGFRRLIRV